MWLSKQDRSYLLTCTECYTLLYCLFPLGAWCHVLYRIRIFAIFFECEQYCGEFGRMITKTVTVNCRHRVHAILQMNYTTPSMWLPLKKQTKIARTYVLEKDSPFQKLSQRKWFNIIGRTNPRLHSNCITLRLLCPKWQPVQDYCGPRGKLSLTLSLTLASDSDSENLTVACFQAQIGINVGWNT